MEAPMKKKSAPKSKRPKLTDADRHARFIETARKIGASEEVADFDRAFKKVASQKIPAKPH
jgi:hypothetical protein